MSGRGRLWSIGLDLVMTVALVGLVCLPVWPGVFTVDSQAIYVAAVTDDVDTWYAPALGRLWGVADGWGMPPAGALVIGVVGLVVSLLALYRLWLGPGTARLATIGTVLWPPVYGMLGWVGRDVWFIGLTLAFLVSVGWAGRLPRWRWWLLAAAGVAAWLAQDARQNGILALAVWGGVIAWWALPERWWRWTLVPLAAVGAVVLGSLLRLFVIAAIDADRVYPEQYLYYRDLLAVSIAVDQSQIPVPLFPTQDLDAVRRFPHLEEAFAGRDPVVVWQPFEAGGDVTAAVRDAWWEMVRARPWDYARSRGRLYLELTTGRAEQSAYFGVSDELDARAPEFQQRFPGWNQWRLEALEASSGEPPGVGGPLHTVWPYVLIGLTGAAVIALVPGPWRVVGLTALFLQVTLQAGLFFLAPTNQWRFQFFQVVLGLVLAVAALATLSLHRRGIRGSQVSMESSHEHMAATASAG